MTLQSQGIVVDGGAAEVPTDAGQPQVHEDEDVQGSGPADGIVEDAAPEAKVLSSISMQEQVVESNRVLHK